MTTVLDTSVLQVLADTRCADQVIRLTKEAVSVDADTNSIDMSEVFLHEWVHYFQFTGTACGIMLSQYRRDCFNSLKICLIGSQQWETAADDSHLEPFLDNLQIFKAFWEAWPPDWYKVESAGRREVSEVRLVDGALHVVLESSELMFTLPVGIHAVFEAHAWCTARLHQEAQSIPRGADSLLYTWPLWLRAAALEVDIDELPKLEIQGVLPLLLIACNYDHRLMPRGVDGIPSDCLALWDELARRDVTVGRMVTQMFNDYERFWGNPLTIANADLYLSRIGLPPLSKMLEQTTKALEAFLHKRIEEFNSVPKDVVRERLVLADDVFVEIDLLQASMANLSAISVEGDNALAWPLSLHRELVPVVCALEGKQGYRWFSVTPFSDTSSERWGDQGSRIILREQLSISEHVLMQMAFGANLACYGPFDWRRPIDLCPMAEECLNRADKRGISFCGDPAWRHVVAVHVSGVFDLPLDPAQAPDDLIPGIGEAMSDVLAISRGERAIPDAAAIDYGALDLAAYMRALRGDTELPSDRPHNREEPPT